MKLSSLTWTKLRQLVTNDSPSSLSIHSDNEELFLNINEEAFQTAPN